MACPHIVLETPNAAAGLTYVQCAIIQGLVGMTCAMPIRECGGCKYVEGDDAFVKKTAKHHLRALLVGGDLPKWDYTLDLPDSFRRRARLSTTQEQADLIREMFRNQVDIPEDEGGHSPEVLEEKLRTLAKEFGIEDAYDEEVSRLAAAVGIAGDSSGAPESGIAG